MNFDLGSIAGAVEAFCAFSALVISIVSLIKSNKASKLQQKVSELDARLKAYDLEEREREKEAQNVACIEARAVKFSPRKQKIRISNTGKARAYNVSFDVLDESISGFFFKDKTPFKFLDSYEHYDEVVVLYANFPSTVEVTTRWENEEGKEFTRENILSF